MSMWVWICRIGAVWTHPGRPRRADRLDSGDEAHRCFAEQEDRAVAVGADRAVLGLP
jgi:hypothetical protein